MNILLKNRMYPYFVCLFIALIALSGIVLAKSPVGLVSNVDGDVIILDKSIRQVDFGDDIILNNIIKVGPGSSLVLIYYSGCRQEWYAESSVIKIGKRQSEIVSGKLEKSERFDCEVPSVVLSEKDSFKKATFHFRGITPVKSKRKKQSAPVKEDEKSKTWRVDNDEQSIDDIKLKMWTAKKDNHYYRTGEHIIIYIVADRDAYITLNYFQANGNVVHLIPNLFKDKYHLKAGQVYVVGGNKSKLKLVVDSPFGEETISALVSAIPFSKEFKTSEIIENTEKYKQKMSKVLSRKNKIAEYALGIWTTP